MGGCAPRAAARAGGRLAASAGGGGKRGDAPAALVLTFSSVAETAEERKALREPREAQPPASGGRPAAASAR